MEQNKTGLDLNKASNILRDGGVVAFPTETVMGMGVIYNDYQAYCKLNELKGRPEDKPYTMMLKSVDEIKKYAKINENAAKLIKKYMPGPLTILLESKENVPSYVTHNTGIVGIRVPKHKLLNELLDLVDLPLLVPSANPSGKPPSITFNNVLIYFNNTLGYIIESNSNGEPPSTIVKLINNDVEVIREGSISKQEILRTIRGD